MSVLVLKTQALHDPLIPKRNLSQGAEPPLTSLCEPNHRARVETSGADNIQHGPHSSLAYPTQRELVEYRQDTGTSGAAIVNLGLSTNAAKVNCRWSRVVAGLLDGETCVDAQKSNNR